MYIFIWTYPKVPMFLIHDFKLSTLYRPQKYAHMYDFSCKAIFCNSI